MIQIKNVSSFDHKSILIKTVKKTADYGELLEYIQHIYYVLMTRGIQGTYLYICDPDLREYFSQYIDVQ